MVSVAGTRNIRIGLIILAAIMIVIPIVRLLGQTINSPYHIILGIVIGAAIAGVLTIVLSLRYPKEVKKEYERQLFELKANVGK